MKKFSQITLLSFLLLSQSLRAQIGVHGPKTISTANTIVNEYTYLTADATAGSTSITVNSNTLNANSRFPGVLTQGDLILIIQMQGATIDATAVSIWSIPNDATWGSITAYNNCGNYEFAQVSSVSGGATINILCGLKNNYTAAGHVQVVRIPRYTTLTVSNSLVGQAWNGNTGGIVSVEVQGNTTINAGGSIDATALGFRGGQVLEDVDVFGGTAFGSSSNGEGAPKGESIAGYLTEYIPLNAQYCRGAPANGGGGGNAHNNGGGGGGNAGNLAAYTGTGNPNALYNTAWNLETPALGGTTSSGGGRGGNSFSSSNQNANTLAPANSSWGGDYNRTNGGLGGRPLDYSTGKLFMGGGGGSGDQNDGDAGFGGAGGGLVFIMSYGNVSGAGSIISNGQAGFSANIAGYPFSGNNGIDGAGGGGGGGTVIIRSNGTTSGITINANGGVGGNQNHPAGTPNDAYGPGGGGGGGYIGLTAGAPTRTATGGSNGTTNSGAFTEFPPKGATSGGTGLPTEVISNYYFTLANQTICYGATATLTATVTGSIPAGVTLNWYATQFGTVSLGTGTSFTTPALTTTTTYYVGFCPGHYRLPVTVTVGPQIVINAAAVVINNETCAGNDGSITGITASGGTGALSYSWNAVSYPSANATALTAGSYTLTVTDASGCTATSGPYVVGTSGGPTLNTTAIVITSPLCGVGTGSITGIVASGGTGALTFTWNGVSSPTTNLSSATPGAYTLVVTDALGCSSSAGPFTISGTGGVTINSAGAIISDATCGSPTGSITGITSSSLAGGLTYDWNGTSFPSNDLTGASGGSYTLTVTDANGCTATAGPFTILSIGGPTIDTNAVSVSGTTCGLNNGSITGIVVTGGTGVLTYDWNGIASTDQNLSSAASGSYTLTVTDASGCSQSAGPFTITPSNMLFAAAVGFNVSCFGLTDGSAVGGFAGGNGGITYAWIGGPATQNYTGIGAGTYQVIVSDVQGCSDTASVTITEPASLNPTITGTGTICEGTSTTLTATGGGTYLWSTGSTASSISVSPTSLSTYTVDVTVGTCTETATFTVNVNPLPVAGIAGTLVICAGQQTTLTASGGTTYIWDDSSTGSSITVNPSTDVTYFVIAQNACGSDTAFATVTVGASFSVDAGPDQTIGLGNSTTISATGGTSFVWSPSSSLDCSTCQSATASPTSTTTYTVIAINASGCSDTDDVTIIVDATESLFVPDIFAPNGNGVNDILYVRGSGIQTITFRVFDRWGQKVFETTDQNTGWDGSFKGRPLDTGVFVYTLDGSFYSRTKISQKGNVTLKR